MEPFKVDQFSKNRAEYCNSDQEEPEEDPEEDPDEDPEEDSEFESENDPETVLSEEPKGVVNEDPSEEDPAEDPLEEDPDEDPSEEDPDEDSSEEDQDEDPSEEDQDEDPSEEDQDEDPSEEDQDEDPSEEDPGVAHASDIEAVQGFLSKSVDDSKGTTEKDHLEKSGKKRRSRWEQQSQQFPGSSQNENIKKRKTRWDINDSQVIPPDPPQTSKTTIGSGFDLDSVAQSLKLKLIEINRKLSSSEIQDDRSLSEKLIQERRRIIAKMMKKIPAMNPKKVYKKLYVPVEAYPNYNFAGLILGPRGNTQKKMEKETGAKILLRGKGSYGKTPRIEDHSDDEDLHVLVEANNKRSLDAAVKMVEELLIPLDDQMNPHKLAQLKELAKLTGTYRDENICKVCKGEGHKAYACPNTPSTLKTIISCGTCGSASHLTSTCPLTASSQVSKPPSSNFNTKSKPKKEIDPANLYVGYLPKSICDGRLREMFSPFGKIISSTVMKDQVTGQSKGYGFVKFEDSTYAALAVKHLHGYEIDGHKLAVRVAGTPPTGTPSIGTVLPALNPIPVYPVPATIYPGAFNQTAWPPQPVSMLPVAQVQFPSSLGLGLQHPVAYSEHGYQYTSNGPTNLSNFAAMPTFNEQKGVGAAQSYTVPSTGPTNVVSPLVISTVSETNRSGQPPNPLAHFPGNQDYPGSAYTVASIGPITFGSSVISTVNDSRRSSQAPNTLASFPGDPDYPGSGFQSYFTARK